MMAPDPDDIQQLTSCHNGVHKDNTSDGTKTTRHPRWTRQETLVLLEGKKAVEQGVQMGNRSTSALGSGQSEPKWDTISSYCKQHGVNRSPVQCRKRWSNLLCDFKKIKTWESHNKDEGNSFWMMRSEHRKEMKLPSFFDREVYDMLDRRMYATMAIPLTIVTVKTEINDVDADEAAAAAEDEEEKEKEHKEEGEDSFRNSEQATAENGMFMNSKQTRQDEIGKNYKKETTLTESADEIPATHKPISVKPFCQDFHYSGTVRRGNPGSSRWMGTSEKGCKRKRLPLDGLEDTNFEDRLIGVLERNTNMLNVQLEAQNKSFELDRNQRKEHNDSIVNVINKFTDALVRIADKL